MLRRITAPSLTLLLVLWLSACATPPQSQGPPGNVGCEAFFIYRLCIADLDTDGLVDYMYFDDSREIFMYEASMLEELPGVLPLHACAIAMSPSVRALSSQLLYSEGLGISERLLVKGKLAVSYRAAQPEVDACNKARNTRSRDPMDNRPFGVDDEWDNDTL